MIIEIDQKTLSVKTDPDPKQIIQNERERERERENLVIDTNSNRITVINTSLSLQTYYYIVNDNKIYLSSTPSHLKNVVPLALNVEVALENIIFVNQLTISCTFKNVQCLNPGQCLTITRENIGIESLFDPVELLVKACLRPKTTDFKRASEILLSAVRNCLDKSQKPMLLALSGGIDSRLIAAAMLYLGSKPTCYTLGESHESDVAVARSLAKEANLDWHQYDSAKTNDLVSCHPDVKRYVTHFAEYSLNSTSLSAAIRRLPLLEYASSYQMIDGGFGEIFRSRYLIKLRLINVIKSIESADIISNLLVKGH